jgi:hypothetical protein
MNEPTLSDVEFILARAFSMEQYNTTAEAREAILRKLMEIYRRGQLAGNTDGLELNVNETRKI